MQNKKIKELLIGTNNIGKLREIRDLLPKYMKTFSTLDFKLKSPKEDGKNFRQNSAQYPISFPPDKVIL